MQWINQGTEAKRVYAFRPNLDVDEWFFVAEDREALSLKDSDEVSADQCGNCGGWVPCAPDDPDREGESFDGAPLKPTRYFVQGDRVYCGCGESFRLALKPENNVIFP